MSPLWLLLISALLTYSNGNDCPEHPDMKNLVRKYTTYVSLESLEGTWMIIQAPDSELKGLDASYSSYVINDAGNELKISVHDFTPTHEKNVYFQSIKQKPGAEKGVLSWAGTYSDGSKFDKNIFITYNDKYVIGYYGCDPTVPIEQGWTWRILVNTDDMRDIQQTLVETPANKSLTEVSNMKMRDEERTWKKSHPGQFGLFGPITQVRLEDLRRPEV